MHRQGMKIQGLLMMGARIGPRMPASQVLTPRDAIRPATERTPPTKMVMVHMPFAPTSGGVIRPHAMNATSARIATMPASILWVD